jgi:MFS transporter, ACS family, tartrate transporter
MIVQNRFGPVYERLTANCPVASKIGKSRLLRLPWNVLSDCAVRGFAQIGVSSVPAMFWPLPASFLTGASAAAGIAAINSLGNLSGFAGPFAMGYLKDLTGNFTRAMP